MKSLTWQEANDLKQQGKTLQEIADIYGCTRQYVHQLINKKPKTKLHKVNTPSKADLYDQVDALTSECIRLQAIIDSKEQEEWLSEKDKAVSTFYRQIPLLPRQIVNLQLDHIDKVGYWFNFELDNDSTRQTYCIRHTDLLEGVM